MEHNFKIPSYDKVCGGGKGRTGYQQLKKVHSHTPFLLLFLSSLFYHLPSLFLPSLSPLPPSLLPLPSLPLLSFSLPSLLPSLLLFLLPSLHSLPIFLSPSLSAFSLSLLQVVQVNHTLTKKVEELSDSANSAKVRLQLFIEWWAEYCSNYGEISPWLEGAESRLGQLVARGESTQAPLVSPVELLQDAKVCVHIHVHV